jgi:hypothetical protein
MTVSTESFVKKVSSPKIECYKKFEQLTEITEYSPLSSVPFTTPYLSSVSDTIWVVTQYGTSNY